MTKILKETEQKSVTADAKTDVNNVANVTADVEIKANNVASVTADDLVEMEENNAVKIYKAKLHEIMECQDDDAKKILLSNYTNFMQGILEDVDLTIADAIKDSEKRKKFIQHLTILQSHSAAIQANEEIVKYSNNSREAMAQLHRNSTLTDSMNKLVITYTRSNEIANLILHSYNKSLASETISKLEKQKIEKNYIEFETLYRKFISNYDNVASDFYKRMQSEAVSQFISYIQIKYFNPLEPLSLDTLKSITGTSDGSIEDAVIEKSYSERMDDSKFDSSTLLTHGETKFFDHFSEISNKIKENFNAESNDAQPLLEELMEAKKNIKAAENDKSN
jgi:predicted transcriptional regulator with HTH domain